MCRAGCDGSVNSGWWRRRCDEMIHVLRLKSSMRKTWIVHHILLAEDGHHLIKQRIFVICISKDVLGKEFVEFHQRLSF